MIPRGRGNHETEQGGVRPVVLSIVIVDSNSADFTLGCIESIFCNPPDVEFEIILVDNCSRISCLPIVNERYPQVRTLTAPAPQGFAKNYNLGMRHAVGAYVLILNNDMLVHAGALDMLLSELERNPDYGMVGGRLVSANGQVQAVCARSLMTPWEYVWLQVAGDPGFPLGKLLQRFQTWKVERRASGPVPCISGACMMVRRDDLQVLGLLDENYDFYFEDIEWCHRVQCIGKRVAYSADALITHFGDQSLSKVKVWAKQSEYRSAIRYFKQYHDLGSRELTLLWFATVVGFFIRSFAFLALAAFYGRRTYAAEYLYLLKWIMEQHVVD